MKKRVGGKVGGNHPSDLLVCFPSRSHLTLMSKPSSSPTRTTADPLKRRHQKHLSRPVNHRHQSSPLFRTNNKPNVTKNPFGPEIGSEPTSPKVTCAGQIKVCHKKGAKNRPETKNWIESLGLKKDVMNFLGALRSLRFNMQCFGSFHGSVDCCSEEEEEEEEDDEDEGAQARTMFSKWFMVLEENQGQGDEFKKEEGGEEEEEEEEEEEVNLAPKNALLLMRCRSAPAKGWLEGEKAVVVEKEEDEVVVRGKGEKDKLMLMSYEPDFFKVSTEIARETWVVGSVDPLERSRSWKR